MTTIPAPDFAPIAPVVAAAAVAPSAPETPATAIQPRIEGILSPTERSVLYARTEGAVEWIPQLEALAHCESSFSPGAVGDSGASRGLYQIQRLWFDLAGEDWEQAFDPAVNLRVAMRIVRYQIERGQPPFNAWTCARGW